MRGVSTARCLPRRNKFVNQRGRRGIPYTFAVLAIVATFLGGCSNNPPQSPTTRHGVIKYDTSVRYEPRAEHPHTKIS